MDVLFSIQRGFIRTEREEIPLWQKIMNTSYELHLIDNDAAHNAPSHVFRERAREAKHLHPQFITGGWSVEVNESLSGAILR